MDITNEIELQRGAHKDERTKAKLWAAKAKEAAAAIAERDGAPAPAGGLLQGPGWWHRASRLVGCAQVATAHHLPRAPPQAWRWRRWARQSWQHTTPRT